MTQTAFLSEIDIVLAKQACYDLVMRFAACNDNRNPQGLGALFVDDGVIVRPNGEVLTGPTSIAAGYAHRPADTMTRHLCGNVMIDVTSAATASGTSTVLLWSASTATPAESFGRRAAARQVIGTFEDSFVKTAQGWRIAKRQARFDLVRGEQT